MSLRQRLLDQTLLILGSAGHMGLATAKLAAAEGARLILVGRNPESLASAAKQLPDASTRSIVADATEEASLRSVFTGLGPVDHVLAAISSGAGAPLPPNAVIPRVDLPSAQREYSRLWSAYNVLHWTPLHVKPQGSVTKAEPWGQTVALQTFEGVIVGISYVPRLHETPNAEGAI